jgi:hypothetical protein
MRHGLHDYDACIMYLQASEMLDHILLDCVFSHQVWDRLLSMIGLSDVVALGYVDIFA